MSLLAFRAQTSSGQRGWGLTHAVGGGVFVQLPSVSSRARAIAPLMEALHGWVCAWLSTSLDPELPEYLESISGDVSL